jgi:4-carboxymuconolactone decarboxylase
MNVSGRRVLGFVLAVIAGLMLSFNSFAQDRMPAMPLDKMNDLQRKYAEEIIKGPRGALYGPFIPLIRSPELMDRAQKIGEYLRYKSAIGTRLSELVILIVARQWTQQVEWAIHEPIALKEGIKPDVIKAIADGRRPVGMSTDEDMIYDFCMELHTNKSISDVTYDRVLKRFGEHGVIDTLGINGYYTMIAMVMNGTRTAVPDGKPGALQPFPK